MYQELNQDNLQEQVSAGKTIVVQYSAGWCGNCRMIKPKFKRMAESHTDIDFLVVDAEQFPASRQLANVNNLPTFALFQGGVLKGQVQTNKADVLQNFINETASN